MYYINARLVVALVGGYGGVDGVAEVWQRIELVDANAVYTGEKNKSVVGTLAPREEACSGSFL